MTRRTLLFALLTIPALLLGAYTYYYTDALTSINSTYWTTNGTVAGTSNGLTATSTNGGSIISLVTPPGTANDYEVKSTLRLTVSGGTYVHYLRASSDAMTGPAPQGTFYSVELTPTITGQGVCSAGVVLNKTVSGQLTQVTALSSVPCRNGMQMRTVYSNGGILIYIDGVNYLHIGDWDITSGQPGIGAFATPGGNSISSVALGPHDGTAPAVVDRTTVAVTAFPTTAELQWKPPSDGTDGIGLWRYLVYRGGTFLGVTYDPEFVDHGAAASQTYTYSILAQDQHANYSQLDFSVNTPPAGSIDPRRIGVKPAGSYWGASGEQIDMLSGNLNYTLPLLQAKGRNGLTATFALNYNSQVWRQDSAGEWRFGRDVGYGFGWRLMLGAITPYWSDYYTLHHYIFTDSTGAEYRLDVQNGTVWSSKEGIYVWYDTSTSRLYFRDGTFWVMGSVSAGTEQDAGTRYPTLVQDTNGNQIVIEYKAGAGVSWINSSARVYQVRDARQANRAYEFTYNTDAIPHLTGIANYFLTSEGYTFSYSSDQALISPFSTTQFGTTRMLNSVTTSGLNLVHQFTYGINNSGELAKVTFPYGGYLKWEYTSQTLSGSRAFREVQHRYLAKNGGTETRHTLYRDSNDVNRTIHVGAWLEDAGAAGMKKWGFNFSGTGAWYDGLVNHYEEMSASWTVPAVRHQDFAWSQDAGLNPFISAVTTHLNPGQTYEKVSKVEQTLDTNGWGNVLWTKLYDYGNLTTPARTYTNTYLTDTNHTSRYIRNRLLTTTLTSGGNSMTLVTNTYGGSYGAPLTDISYLMLHDSAYNTTFYYRGNLVSRTVPGKPTTYFRYDIIGNVTRSYDAQNRTVDLTTSWQTGYTAPSIVTPNSTDNLASSFTYTSFLGIASATAPNASTTSYTYDSYARPTSTTSPHGAVTNYTYDDTPLAAWEKSTTNNKWVKKTKDGLGRVVLVETGYGTTTVSKVTTEYAPCSCSPLGRVYRVSQPYSGTSPTSWTTYTYDALGRTTCVSLPGNSGSTTYAYEGNAVTVTDPASRWKKYETDAFGNVTKVIEPNPQGGANHETTYAYDMFNRLTTVTMPRSGTTQTRTFSYNTLGQLVTTVNPENGTTTLAYNTDGSLFSKTDQKGQRIEYSYDTFRRVTQARKYLPGNQTDEVCQRVNYYYDTNPFDSYFTQNGWGHLAVAEYGDYSCTGGQYRESYSYTAGGLPVKKKLWMYGNGFSVGSLLGEWSYDNEGKMLTVKYPDSYDSQGNTVTGRTYTYSYNSMGQLSKLVDDRPGDPPGWEWVNTTTYNVAGQLTSMSGWNGFFETREYNERLQLTRIYNGPDIHYYYPDAQNNDGRITRKNVGGVDTTYTYDALGRLSTAGTASYTYDGFGNRTGQTSPLMNLTYNAANNRITTTGYSYDNNGNLTGTPTLTMSYDVENRLVEATHTQNGTERYRYSPSGQRVWKLDPWGGPTVYFYGVNGRLLATYTTNGYYDLPLEESTNVYFGSRTLQAQGQTGMKEDRLGTVGYWPTTYAPFGDSGISGTGLGFTGYYGDSNTGLDYAQQRYYAPGIGRFTSPDPYVARAAIARPQNWNRYAYVENDPVNRRDPSGLDWIDEWFEDLDVDLFSPKEGVTPSGPMGPISPDTTSGGPVCWLEPNGGENSGYHVTCINEVSPKPPSLPQPECFAQLKYRPVQDELAKKADATHSFWYVQDRTGSQFIISGGPAWSDDGKTKYLQVWVSEDLNGGVDNVSASTFWDTGLSSDNCDGVGKLLAAARGFPKSKIKYHPLGPNSNTAARYLGAAGGFNPNRPPGAFGWDDDLKP